MPLERDDLRETLCDQLPSLYQLAKWYTRNPIEAEDLVQDTLVLALRFSDSYKRGTSIRAWLSRVMRNRFISASRRRSLERRVMDLESDHALNDWCVGEMGRKSMAADGGVYRDKGFSDPVVRALDELKPEYRQIVWLCDVEGLSYADAAQKANCPLGTVMSRLHRGRRTLRAQLTTREELAAA